MLNNDAQAALVILSLYAKDDDLRLLWHSGSPQTPMDDEIPQKLEIRNLDDKHLVDLFALSSGFDTVLEALLITKAEFKKLWPHTSSPREMRVRLRGGKFEVRSIR